MISKIWSKFLLYGIAIKKEKCIFILLISANVERFGLVAESNYLSAWKDAIPYHVYNYLSNTFIRVESMESILEALRTEKNGKKHALEINVRDPPPSTPLPRQLDFTSRMILYARDNGRRRKKRSSLYALFRRNGWGMAFTKKTITWRLVCSKVYIKLSSIYTN